MATSRIQIASNKKSALLKQSMREIALMLAEDPPKEEKAKIRAEALIRDDNMIEAYEILQLECELLHERMKLIEYSNKTCPSDLIPVVSTLMWASHRVDIPELALIRKQFRAKYGKQFEENAMGNVDGVLNERVVTKLSIDPPAAYLVQTYLERICEQHEVDWKPKVSLTASEMAEPMAAPVGYSVPLARGTGLGGNMSVPETGMSLNGDRSIQPSGHSAQPSGQLSINPSGKHEDSLPPPVVTATAVSPLEPTNSVASSVTGAVGDFDEPDIFIPGAPSAPPGSNGNTGIPPVAPSDGAGAHPGTGAGAGSSYEDLTARFNKLNK